MTGIKRMVAMDNNTLNVAADTPAVAFSLFAILPMKCPLTANSEILVTRMAYSQAMEVKYCKRSNKQHKVTL
jgi:hypothetical protein